MTEVGIASIVISFVQFMRTGRILIHAESMYGGVGAAVCAKPCLGRCAYLPAYASKCMLDVKIKETCTGNSPSP